MDLLEERAILVLDFIPELMSLLNAFSTQGLQIRSGWSEELSNISYRCPACNEVVLFIVLDENTKQCYCRGCGYQLPADHLIVRLRASIDTPDESVELQQEFLFEILTLWRGYQFKGIQVGKVFEEVTQSLRLYNIERRLQILLELEPTQKQLVPEGEIEELVNALTEHRIIAPPIGRDNARHPSNTGQLNVWMNEQRDFAHRFLVQVIARYIIWLDSENMGSARGAYLEAGDLFWLGTVRDFIADVKAHSHALHREGLQLKRVWGELFGTSVNREDGTLEDEINSAEIESNHLCGEYRRVLERIQSWYERLGLDVRSIYQAISIEIEFSELMEVESRRAVLAEIDPLSTFLDENTTLPDFKERIIVKEIAQFIIQSSDDATVNFLPSTYGDPQLCRLPWHFI
ncbi:MAG: hypothetical protein ACTSQQ_15420, partial [Candidatus Helarchaeota archaeon]